MDEGTLTGLIAHELTATDPRSDRRHQRIADYVETWPAYTTGTARYAASLAGYRSFEPRNAAAQAVDVARRRGSALEGARWLIKILAATRATVRLIVEVGGVEVTEKDIVIGDMILTDGTRLPRGAFTDQMVASASPEGVYQTGLAYIYREIERTDLWATKRVAPDKRPDPFEPLRTFAARLAIIGEASPAITRVWSEHLDPDLNVLFGSKGWGQPGQDAAAPWYPQDVTPDDLPMLEKLYGLTGPFAKVIDIALRRINLGRRRVSPGDTAIDAAIALEALLGDPNGNSDMTYKLRLRTALLLADTLAGRRTLSEEVRALYTLRSRVAHGGEPKRDAYVVAARGVQIVREVLHNLVERTDLPDWPEWELAGGDPASFSSSPPATAATTAP